MTESQNSNTLNWILGGALFLIGLFVIIALVSVRSQATSVSTTVGVTNVAPSVDSVYVNANANDRVPTYNDGSTVIPITSNSTTEIHINGAISDANGVGTSLETGDLASVKGILFLSDFDNSCAGSPDNNNCYYDAVCDLTESSATSIYYDCAFDIQYWADSSSVGGPDSLDTWVASVKVSDDGGLNDTNETVNTLEMQTLVSLNIPTLIDYGTLTRAEATTNTTNVEMTITQYGNDIADVDVAGTGMNCSAVGSIAVWDQEWALSDLSHSAVGSTDLNSGAGVDTNLAVPYRTSESAETTKILYWNIVMPSAVSGTCTGTVVMTAFAS